MCSSLWFFNGAENGLGFYLKVLSQVNLFVGGSTGPTHLANLVGTPQISFFSPIKAQVKERWGPLQESENSKVFTPDVICEEKVKCAGASCQFYQCMGKISVDDVFKEAEQLLGLHSGVL